MLGVSLIYTFTHSRQGEGIHWDQAGPVLLSLLISPIVGFGAAALMLWALRKFVKTPSLFEPADPEKSPPHWVRGLLIATCTGVSFAHGSNDGQKGMGLLMLVLMVALPSSLALNSDMKPAEFQRLTTELGHGIQSLFLGRFRPLLSQSRSGGFGQMRNRLFLFRRGRGFLNIVFGGCLLRSGHTPSSVTPHAPRFPNFGEKSTWDKLLRVIIK